MRIVGAILGWLFILASIAVAVWEFLAPDKSTAGYLRPAGEVWFRIDTGSLNLVQAVVERYIWPPLWDPAISSLLHVPAIVLFAVPGLLLVLLNHLRLPRKRRKRRFK